MNPCFVTTSFSPGQHNSGISNALYLLVKYLHEKKGVHGTVFAPVQAWGKTDQDLGLVSIRRFKATNFLNYLYSPSLVKRLEEEHNKNKFDFVHAYHFGFFPAAAGYNFSRKHEMRHFLTPALHPPSPLFKRFLMTSYNYIQGRSVLSGSVVFPFNKNEREQLSKYAKIKYRTVPCPVNNEIFYPRKSKFSKLTITYLGTFLPWKGPQIALEIFNKIGKERKDANFMLIGTGPLEAYLRQHAGPNTKVLSGLPSGKVAEILSKSDVVVCPTLYESFGSAIAESMMCGTPVVSTRVGAVPETVGPGGIMVDYGDWDDMKESVIRLLDDSRLRKKMAQLAVRHANKYKYERVARDIYSSYK